MIWHNFAKIKKHDCQRAAVSSLLSNLKTWLLLQKHGDLGYHYSSTEGLLRCHKIEKFRVANGTESNRLKHFLQIREIMEKGLGIFVLPQVVLISSIKPISSSYLFKYGSVEYWKEDSSFLTNQPDCFRIGSYQ